MHCVKPLSYIHLTAGKVNLFVKMFCFKHPLGMNIGKCMKRTKTKNTTNLSQVILGKHLSPGPTNVRYHWKEDGKKTFLNVFFPLSFINKRVASLFKP